MKVSAEHSELRALHSAASSPPPLAVAERVPLDAAERSGAEPVAPKVERAISFKGKKS